MCEEGSIEVKATEGVDHAPDDNDRAASHSAITLVNIAVAVDFGIVDEETGEEEEDEGTTTGVTMIDGGSEDHGTVDPTMDLIEVIESFVETEFCNMIYLYLVSF
ncbi:hypothetical protein ANCCEY_02038 [Ancylostoma ceylanicum]|uniref:Uncharacterized protein n=1 Tax=Ancylostoma ceylanicum TaxID=53326 RepID=A0A0D6M8V7_9BILA|nr:hypothetical protein ANCCEY_02038 [Ancylostoma ceylanicum]